eukprot:NODE_63_length_26141_cov_1.022656.p26 type:complete len:117 gc:universal NODE_63_length_26141_cov_1.022656:20197-20547(+)
MAQSVEVVLVTVRLDPVNIQVLVISIYVGDQFRGFVSIYKVFFIIGALIVGIPLLMCGYKRFRKKKNRVQTSDNRKTGDGEEWEVWETEEQNHIQIEDDRQPLSPIKRTPYRDPDE